MEQKKVFPFSKGNVLRITAKYMRKAIDVSIRKTFDCIEKNAADPAISREIFETLSILHTMRRQLDDFQSENRSDFSK